nr:hypothetical protein [uncultured Porphyromonas sp.]
MKTKVRLYLTLLSVLCGLSACSRGLGDEPQMTDHMQTKDDTHAPSDSCMI